jgi:hypothetical protein
MGNVLESLVGTLPAKVQPYAKTYAAALTSGLAVASGMLDFPVWLTVALAVANAPIVFAVPNLEPAPVAFAKVKPADPTDPTASPRGGIWGGG